MEERDTLVTLIDENEAEVTFDLVLTFDYEGKRYAALLPVDEVEGVDEDEVVLLEVVNEDGEESYRSIESEILLNEVFDEFLELFDELVNDDEEDE
ncbi:MAG: DUF1292 domain-containing protein [Clostridia bacterium]|nr:DUF1292 domain-containing protein [Clostridia bacterium]